MTASSVEFFPCRVQLIGLPLSSTSLAATNASIRLGNSTRPSIAKINGISRNLFGAPDPVEMKNLYKQEAERQRSYVLQRYNFDTQTSKPMIEQQEVQQKPTDYSNTNQTILTSVRQPTQFPTLIEQELSQHEKQLLNEEHSLNFASSKTPQFNEKSCYHAKNTSNVTRRCCECSSLLLHTTERQKPYTRQSLLTEAFNMRKNRVIVTKIGNQNNDEKISLENIQSSHRNLKKLQLPQSINSKQKTFAIKDKRNEQPTHNIVNNHEMDGIVINRSSTINDKNNCTTLSLQFTVSTKNLS